jgi:hypothetical protein
MVLNYAGLSCYALALCTTVRKYMQLPIAGFLPAEPRCSCCGLKTYKFALKRQLSYILLLYIVLRLLLITGL